MNIMSGAEVVYGVRSSRKTDTFFKRATAEGFYKFLRLMGAEVVYNHADYRLVSAKVLKEFSGFKEVNLFLRGMIPLVGFKSTSVYYERNERLAGKSHYPLKKMIALAMDGITSLSTKPLHMIMTLGIFVSVLSFIGAVWAVVMQVIRKHCCRLGKPHCDNLLHGRNTAYLLRNNRGIYWKDIHGGKRKTKVYSERKDK